MFFHQTEIQALHSRAFIHTTDKTCCDAGHGEPGGMKLKRAVLDTNIWLDWLVFDNAEMAPLKAARSAGRLSCSGFSRETCCWMSS